MTAVKSAAGVALVGDLRRLLEQLTELDKREPADVDAIVEALVAHLRSWRPVAIAPLGTLPDPEEPIRGAR
jgi:hypothetical protein